ncbi:MAG: Coenzyme F420 hydrogenase/dehydrogenase, beta subunit C-terminal domain [Candidatus Omnitrophica bacterium]|nr:Coenzyme F420 hydrogenase/dehydrogenase, beta subunit C-terminal domain [Candidatus Omnitrophota bacterium]
MFKKKINSRYLRTVFRTRSLNLCISCEICRAVCPVGAITMEYSGGQFLPKIARDKCINCKACLSVCPGFDLDWQGIREPADLNDSFYQNQRASYTLYCKDQSIRNNSTSGGFITSLLAELIKNKEYDYAFVLNSNISQSQSAMLSAENNASAIISSAKSKYVPVSVYNLVKTLKDYPDKKYVVVGTSCSILGIRKFLGYFDIPKDNCLFLGLFCEKTMNFNMIKFFGDRYRTKKEKLNEFTFRNKNPLGWPGSVGLGFDSGRTCFVDRRERMNLKKFFQLNRCLFCLDKFNLKADISCGDCYIVGKSDSRGKSSVIVRSKLGQEIFNRYSYLFESEVETIDSIVSAQNITEKDKNLLYLLAALKNQRTPISRELARLKKYLSWGRDPHFFKLKLYLLLEKKKKFFVSILRRFKNRLRRSFFLRKFKSFKSAIFNDYLIPLECLLIFFLKSKNKAALKKSVKNVVICGGETENKGSLAMIFVTVDQVRRRFPEARITVLSFLYSEVDNQEKSKFNFELLPYSLSIMCQLLPSAFLTFRKRFSYSSLIDLVRESLESADVCLDISGYALGTGWGKKISLRYLMQITIARKYSIPFYILPQSMGPLDYDKKDNLFTYPLMKLCLRYPQKIYLRENQALKSIEIFRNNNFEKAYDIVLQNKFIDLKNVYRTNYPLTFNNLLPDAVGLIPNYQVLARTDKDNLYKVYAAIIEQLLNRQKKVYILRHSRQDVDVCRNIKNFFPTANNVIVVDQDLNSIELDYCIGQFQFLVACRYHSIVGAYKQHIPVLAIGWAVKYLELLETFGQSNYLIDVSGGLDILKVNQQLEMLLTDFLKEKEKIKQNLKILEGKNNPFDEIF